MTALAAPLVAVQVENTSGATSIALPYPAASALDYLLFPVAVKNGTIPTLPAGWTAFASLTNAGTAGQPALLVAGKPYAGETGNLAVTTPNVVSIGQMWAVSDVDLTNPINAILTKLQPTGATTIVLGPVTTVSDGTLLVAVATDSASLHTSTPPAGFTETADLSIGTQPLQFSWKLQATATTTGTATVSWLNGTSPGTAQSIGVLIALNPRVAPAVATGSGQAFDATVTSTTLASIASGFSTGTGVANDATVVISNPPSGYADGTGQAFDATVQTSSLFTSVTAAGGTQIVPGVAIRIRAEYKGVAYTMWTGNIDSWDISYIQPTYSDATINATDATKMIAMSDRPAVTSIGGGELTGDRVHRVLDSIGWPTVDRLIDDGDSTLQATDLSGNAWSELQTSVLSEAGDVFIDSRGLVNFRHRRAYLSDDDLLTPVAIFGDAPGELPFFDLEFSYDDDALWNTVGATNNGGERQVAQDGDSQARYGNRAVELAGLLLEEDSDAANYAGYVLHLSKNPELRISGITIHPDRDPDNLYPVVLTLGYTQRIRVNLTNPDTSRITRDVFIRGISHSITPQGQWETKYVTQSASQFGFWRIGDPNLGQIGTFALSF